MSELKVSVIFTNYGPYHISRVKSFTELLEGRVFPVQFFPKDVLREWKTDDQDIHIYTAYKPPMDKSDNSELKKSVINILDRMNPDVVAIAGYGHPVMRAVAKWTRNNNSLSVLLSESNHYDRRRIWLKEKFKSYWIRKHFDAAFVSGIRASRYLETLGFPVERIWRGYSVVDNAYFTDRALEAKKHENSVRHELDLPENYFLYVGRLSPEKNLYRLLDAYSLYKDKSRDEPWGLVIVGSGPQENELREYADELGLTDVLWTGFRQVDELPSYYALASCFILPSTSEPWGLVVNEAMACGLPVLVSNNCGCVPELVHPGINGYVFDPYNIDEMIYFMERISSQDIDIGTMGKCSISIIGNYTPKKWAKTLADCVNLTSSRKLKTTSV